MFLSPQNNLKINGPACSCLYVSCKVVDIIAFRLVIYVKHIFLKLLRYTVKPAIAVTFI